MQTKSFICTLTAATFFALPALAGDIKVTDSYARSSSPAAKTGAAFLVIENHAHADDRLIGVSSDAAARAQLHTHKEDANGVVAMIHVEDGFALPAHGEIVMRRGGDHVMLMGLSEGFEQGDTVSITLHFEHGEDLTIDVPVDLERKPSGGHGEGHSNDHSKDHSHSE